MTATTIPDHLIEVVTPALTAALTRMCAGTERPTGPLRVEARQSSTTTYTHLLRISPTYATPIDADTAAAIRRQLHPPLGPSYLSDLRDMVEGAKAWHAAIAKPSHRPRYERMIDELAEAIAYGENTIGTLEVTP